MRELSDDISADNCGEHALTAELLLLLRLVLTDEVAADTRSCSALRRVAMRDFSLGDAGTDEVLAELEAVIAAAGQEGAAGVLRDLPLDRRRTLGLRLATIAAEDEDLSRLQGRLARRAGVVLGIGYGR